MVSKKESTDKNAGKKLLVRQVRSVIGRDKHTRQSLQALGFGKIGTERTFVSNPALLCALKQHVYVLDIKEV